MANIYRKTALDKLSSPDQLDKAITIISPSFWIAALGGGLILAVALIWSILGRLPVNVSTSGIFMGQEGLGTVVSEGSGVVTDVYVSEGEYVKAGQEIAQLDVKVTEEEINGLKKMCDLE